MPVTKLPEEEYRRRQRMRQLDAELARLRARHRRARRIMNAVIYWLLAAIGAVLVGLLVARHNGGI